MHSHCDGHRYLSAACVCVLSPFSHSFAVLTTLYLHFNCSFQYIWTTLILFVFISSSIFNTSVLLPLFENFFILKIGQFIYFLAASETICFVLNEFIANSIENFHFNNFINGHAWCIFLPFHLPNKLERREESIHWNEHWWTRAKVFRPEFHFLLHFVPIHSQSMWPSFRLLPSSTLIIYLFLCFLFSDTTKNHLPILSEYLPSVVRSQW